MGSDSQSSESSIVFLGENGLMKRDLVWIVLVLILGGSVLVLLNSGEDTDSNLNEVERITCPEGEALVENSSNSDGYHCVLIDPHDEAHTHPAPTLTITNVVDNGSTITIDGVVAHLHPSEVVVIVSLNSGTEQSVSVNDQAEWSVLLQSDAEGIVIISVTASHSTENTVSEVTTIEVDRTPPVNDDTGDDTNNTTNETVDQGNNTSNETDDGGNETVEPEEPTNPVYNSSDMGQFWMDVFRCQPGQNVVPVDDLTTTETEALECSVSITMNETHMTITSNGLPDHDFESTLACSQANDCARAQNYEWTIPRSPVNDTTGGHDATNCPEAQGDYECAAALGEVAIAINGVPFYGPEDGPGGDAVASHHGVYVEDRQPIELGVCHAHAGQGGTYHYHADANCLHWHPEEGEDMHDYDISTPTVVANNTYDGNHSQVIGVAMDGYPIYGFWGYDDDMNIVEMTSSYRLKPGETGYNGIDDYEYVQGLGHLDVCNGHFGPTPDFPEGIYHYHSTIVNGEGEMGFPYFLICYHGEAELDAGGGGGADCSGYGVTWGPGIGPPPPGCEGGPGAQLEDVENASRTVVSPYAMIWLLLFAFALLMRRRT